MKRKKAPQRKIITFAVFFCDFLCKTALEGPKNKLPKIEKTSIYLEMDRGRDSSGLL